MNRPTDRTETYKKYLDALNFQSSDTVCMWFNGDKNFFQTLEALKSSQAIERIIARNEGGQNVYFSMAAFQPGTTNRVKEAVASVRHLWVDADANGPATLDQIKKDVADGIIPNFTVAVESSPGKLQVVWTVDQEDFLVSGKADIAKQESLNRALALRYKTDASVVDAGRVLRVPGFVNHKYADKPLALLLEVGDGTRWKATDFKIAVAESQAKKPIDASLNGDKIPYGSHDSELTRIAGKLRECGCEPDGIAEQLIKICEARCENHGADYVEMCEKIARSIGKKPVGKEDREYFGSSLAGPTNPSPSGDVQPLVSVDGDAFMKEQIPPRKVLLRLKDKQNPIFFEQSINQVFAWRGLGKTCIGFGMTAAFAKGGSLLNWEAPERCRVLYVEGELPASQAQERWKQIIGETNGYARLITIDKQPGNTIPSLATETGMARIEKTLAQLEAEGFKTDVLVLDSISTLFNISANDEEPWMIIQNWLISLRSRGLCIFFLHHAGKSGMSRSHSKSEDMLDVSIKLDFPKEPDSGCLHVLMHYDKARAGFSDPDTEIKMHRVHSEACPCQGKPSVVGCPGDRVRWEFRAPGDQKRFEAERRFSTGVSNSDIADELDIVPSTVRNWRKKWSAKAKEQRLN